MRKRTILAVASVVLLGLLLASPYLLERRSLQDRLLDHVEQSLGVKATVGEIGWRWLPVPAISLSRLKADSASFSLLLPQAHLILNPRFFFSGQVSLARARLFEPELVVKEGSSALWAIPDGHLLIVNGTLSLPAHALRPDLTLRAATLTAVNGTVSSRAKGLKFDLTAVSDATGALTFKGSADLLKARYRIDGSGEGLDSRRLFAPFPPDSVLPVVTGLKFSARLEGEGPDHFRLRLGSTQSPFTVSWRQQEFRVAGLDALTVSREGKDVAIDVNKLMLADPRFSLSGRVARFMGGMRAATAPEWFIDLSGADIDLGAVRASILALFGNHLVARKVCAIVRGGSATTARYLFKGVVADFEHVERMKIWADAKDVPLTIPHLGLELDRASGPIAIIDGRLTGKGLSADIDKSHGVNGDFLLDLGRDRHGFTLDLDLDADLQNLQDVLSQIIPSPRFQEELSRFVEIKGRAQGHLRLGDDLRHVLTVVDVIKAEASGLYDRLPWPFTITGGRLQVAPQQVDWQEVSGTLGWQRIDNSQGGVTWRDGVSVEVKALDADLDLASFFTEGTLLGNGTTFKVRDFMGGRIGELSGKARLTDTTFSGTLGRSKEWRYHTAVNCSDLVVAVAGLPALSSRNVDAGLSEQQANFAGIFSLFEQELFLAGRYRHSFLGQWQGELEVNGEIGLQLGEWLKEQEPLSDATFPKLPFLLENFVVTNRKPGLDSLLVSGTVIPLPRQGETRLQLSLDRQPDQAISTLTFLDGTREGSLRSQTWPDRKDRKLLTWEGELTFDTLNTLFPQPFLKSGRMQGAFSRQTDQGATAYSGSMEAKDVSFSPESLTPDLTFASLRLRGDQQTITVEDSDLALAGVPAAVTGRVSETGGVHTLDLHAQAPKLAWKSLKKFFEVYNKRAAPAPDEEKSLLDRLRGTVAFDIGAFDYTRQVRSKEEEAKGKEGHTYTATPFKGSMTLSATGIDMQVTDSKICGIGAQGNWHFRDASKEDTVTFTNGTTPLFFEKALPCLGIKQSLIMGPFSLRGRISGRPEHWREGSVFLTSPGGLIKRMALLSRIFTAVNVTDYFTWEDLPDLEYEGLSYNELAIKGHVEDNSLVLDRTIVKGKGVNLSGRGNINLTDLDSDLTFFIAPFKTIDRLVTSLPLIGKALSGPKESILTIPVAVTGDIRSPEVTALAPEAVGSAVLELFRDTVTLPFRIFMPDEENSEAPAPEPKPPPKREEDTP